MSVVERTHSMTGILYIQAENVFCEIKTDRSAVTGAREEWIPRHTVLFHMSTDLDAEHLGLK